MAIPVWQMVRESVKNIGGEATYKQIIENVKSTYGEVNEGTIRDQIILCTVNQPSRVHFPVNNKPRVANGQYDFLFSLGRGLVVPYDPKIHGNWEIVDYKGKPKVAKDGKVITETEDFFFTKKDFESRTGKKEDAQYLADKFKILLNILKQKLPSEFEDSKSYSSPPNNRPDRSGKVTWKDHMWLGFALKDALVNRPQESVQFQVSISRKGVGCDIWISFVGRQQMKLAKQHIEKNQNQFLEILKKLPTNYTIAPNIKHNTPATYQASSISSDELNKIIQVLDEPNSEFHLGLYWNEDEAINLGNNAVDEIVDTFSKLMPAYKFLNGLSYVSKENYFILTQYPDSKYENIEGKQHQYDNQVPNSRKITENSSFIIQSKINNQNYFVGHGKIGEIKESPSVNEKGNPITKFVANFSDYQKFESPKLRTEELYDNMKSMKAFGNQPPSILPITRQLFAKITGEDIEDIPDTKLDMESFTNILFKKKQLIFYGPPGTGKTFTAKKLADFVTNKNTSSPTLTFREAAIKILQEEGKPLHYEEITKRALDQKLVQTKGETPEFTMLKEMSKEIQVLGDSATFTRVDKGTYGLNPNIDIEPDLNWNKNPETNHKFVRSVTFHQSYSYEEFIEGLRPQSVNKQIVYNIENGIFKKLCEDARADPNNKYVILIDEINRGNISKIFGELITLIEKDKRGSVLQLSYSKDDFSVPENLYIIGTMNTADRSLTQLDVALRRRFGFCELMPDYSIINHTIEEIPLAILLENLNKRIRQYEGREKQIGHSYFMQDGVPLQTIEDLQFVFANEIVPLLQDYFYEDYDKLQQVLGNEFVDVKNMEIKSDWKENKDAFKNTIKKFVSNG